MAIYFRTHFHDEEKLMEAIKFPGLKEHKLLHFSYIDKTAEFNFAKIAEKDTLAKEMMEFLIYWWQNHIIIDDMKYKEFLRAQNDHK